MCLPNLCRLKQLTKQVIDSSGTVQAVSPPFRLTDPPGVTIVSDARTAAVHKGDMARIEWNFADKPFPVSRFFFSWIVQNALTPLPPLPPPSAAP